MDRPPWRSLPSSWHWISPYRVLSTPYPVTKYLHLSNPEPSIPTLPCTSASSPPSSPICPSPKSPASPPTPAIDCVELMCWPASKAERRYAGVTHVDVTDFTSAKADDVRRIMADAKVAISGPGLLSQSALAQPRRKRPRRRPPPQSHSSRRPPRPENRQHLHRPRLDQIRR